MSEVLVVAMIVGAGGGGFALGRQIVRTPRHRIERGRPASVGQPCAQALSRLRGLDHRFDDLERRMGEVERSVAQAANEVRMAVAQAVAFRPPVPVRPGRTLRDPS